MYNIHAYEKQQSQRDQKLKKEKRLLSQQKVTRARNEELSRKYRTRIGSFISKMMHEPNVQVDSYVEHQKAISKEWRKNSPGGLQQDSVFQPDKTNNNDFTYDTQWNSIISYADDPDSPEAGNATGRTITAHQRDERYNQLKLKGIKTISNSHYGQSKPLYKTSVLGNSTTSTITDASSRIQAFRFTSNQKERISNSIKKNSIMDTSPSRLHKGYTHEQIMNLRRKDVTKELGPEMRYQPKNYVEKLTDHVKVQYSHKQNSMYTPNLVNSRNKLRQNLEQGEQKDVQTLLTKLGFHHRSHKALEPLRQQEKGQISNDKSRSGTSPSSIVRPRYILPQLHDKTHFKAANEYHMILEKTNRSLDDKNREIEKQLEDAQFKILAQKFKNEELEQNPKLDAAKFESTFTTNSGSYKASPVVKREGNTMDVEAVKLKIKQLGQENNLQPHKLTEEMLKATFMIRPRNLSVQPTRARVSESRNMRTADSYRSAFGKPNQSRNSIPNAFTSLVLGQRAQNSLIPTTITAESAKYSPRMSCSTQNGHGRSGRTVSNTVAIRKVMKSPRMSTVEQ